jgi:hypothetical protein
MWYPCQTNDHDKFLQRLLSKGDQKILAIDLVDLADCRKDCAILG